MAERGSVLVLMPAAVLVFIILGALGVDHAVVFLAEREMANVAAAAANDAATRALDRPRFYETGSVTLVPGVAEQVAAETLRSARLDHLRNLDFTVTVAAGAPIVTVTVSARVPYLFSDAVPGGPDDVAVSATAVASAEQG